MSLFLAIALSRAVPPAPVLLEPQMPTGTRLKVDPQTLDREQAAITAKGFAQCVYARKSAKVDRFLAASDPVTAEAETMRKAGETIGDALSMEDCLGKQGFGVFNISARFGSTTLRALLVEEAYLSRHHNFPGATATAATGRQYFGTGLALERAQSLGALADCVVARDAVHADALVRTTPGGQAQRAAATLVAPAFGQCITAGQSIALTPANMRVIVADGLWQRYVAAPTLAVPPQPRAAR